LREGRSIARVEREYQTPKGGEKLGKRAGGAMSLLPTSAAGGRGAWKKRVPDRGVGFSKTMSRKNLT